MTDKQQKGTWLKLVVTVPDDMVDAVSDYMVGMLGAAVEVSVEDVVEHRVVNGFLEQKDLAAEEINSIAASLDNYLNEMAAIFNTNCPTFEAMTIEEQDWSENWKVHFKPFEVIPGVIIAPTWEDYQAKENELVIEMDPGMAFGTGHHPTTSMSIALIKKAVEELGSCSVVDVGTGTGVLGMAALLLGAQEVYGVDNDIEAVCAAADNIKHNGLSDRFRVSSEDVADTKGPYSLVVANIIHDVLIMMKDDLIRLTGENGQIVLSGLLQGEQVENIINVFTAKGELELIDREGLGEWGAVRFKRIG